MNKKGKRTPKGLSVKACMVLIQDDFVIAPNHNNSLTQFLSENPDGVPNVVAREMLGLLKWEHQEALDEAERVIRQHLES